MRRIDKLWWYKRLIVILLFLASWAPAQSPSGSLAGTVTDPSGALVRGAEITLSSSTEPDRFTATDSFGVFRFTNLNPGAYSVTVTASGFAKQLRKDIHLAAGQTVRLNFSLKIEIQQQQIDVGDEGVIDSNPTHSAGAVVLKDRDLAALSTDPQQLQLELRALAGGDTQFFIDGFSGGKLPPKSAIREIRINENPYSTEYDTIGYGRVEIFTKPGTDKLHGEFYMLSSNSAFNSRNPFVQQQPPYNSYYEEGSLNGPVTKTTSFSVAGEQQNYNSQSFVNAVTSLDGTRYQQAVASPIRGTEITPRFDIQAGKIHSLSLRYQYSRLAQDNLLSSQFLLPSQAVDTVTAQHIVQFSDTQMYGAKVVNEMRFQYLRNENDQVAHDHSPSIVVEGAFTGGGNTIGTTRDHQDSYEFQDNASIETGNHFLHFGGRYRAIHAATSSMAGFNGQFIFSSLEDYAAGQSSQFSITLGTPKVSKLIQDVGVYAEDDWKFRHDMTFSYGMRYEGQTGMDDHIDIAPRFSYAWAIGETKDKSPKAVLRAGTGIFYARFTPDLALRAKRLNGILQRGYVIDNPDFYPQILSEEELQAIVLPTVYRISPFIHAPYQVQSGVSIEKTFFKKLSVSANYLHTRGVDQFLTRNINAPLPGTYPAEPVYPYGTTQNIYQYESEGASKSNSLIINSRMRAKHFDFFSNYTLSFTKANTAGASSFPSNQYDLHVDWGRAANDMRNRAYTGSHIDLPWKFVVLPFLVYESGIPFNITTGIDRNGDGQFNDRPAFATDLNRSSVYRTRFGSFDADPLPSQTIIPINYGKSPSLLMLNGSLRRKFAFGPVTPDDTPDAPAPQNSKPAKKKEVERRYNMLLGVSIQNLLNTVNGAPPVGVLGSPLFGQSTALTGSMYSVPWANRIIYLNLQLEF